MKIKIEITPPDSKWNALIVTCTLLDGETPVQTTRRWLTGPPEHPIYEMEFEFPPGIPPGELDQLKREP